MSLRRLLLLLIVAAALLPLPVLAEGTPTPEAGTPSASPGATTGPGVIIGKISNGTPNGGGVGGLNIKLGRYQGTTLEQEWSATTDESGAFEFKNLPVSQGEMYVATASYKGITFPSSTIDLTENPKPAIDLKVYESTNDPTVIQLVSRGVIIGGAEQGGSLLDIFEIVSLDNKSDRAYIGTDGVVLKLPLPAGASQIIPEPGFNFGQPSVQNGDLITTGAIPPGGWDVIFAYLVPYSGTTAQLGLRSAMPTDSLSVLVKDGTFKVTSPAMQDAGVADISNTKYRVLSLDRPVTGDVVMVTVSGLPKRSSSDSSRGALYAAIAAGVGLIAAGGLTFRVLRRRRQLVPAVAGAGGAGASNAPGTLEDERLALAAELNQLDEDRAADRIDEESYQKERGEILEELRILSRQRRGLEEAEG